ncbi:MAG: LysM peptidoglycan-binding domain-containing protein, partial [Proteobacteria bacterium]|nr:LysM peptidoglycan-binding domain-containing protein [Pseudomonadota bacterium]
RAIEELKTNNYWRISDTNQIRRETKDYIPKLIAAAIIAKNPNKYGFKDISYQEPLEFDQVKVTKPTALKELARAIDCGSDEMLDLNPSFIKGITPPSGEIYDLRVPVGTKTLVERKLAATKWDQTVPMEAPSNRSKMASNSGGDKPENGFVIHIVQKGDSLWSISEQYDVTIQNIFRWNNLQRSRIFPGTRLKIQTQPNVQNKVSAKNKRYRDKG